MLIAIEGVDGCGKTTQVEMLAQILLDQGLEPYRASFPRYADPVFGDLIRRFLRGQLGDVRAVDPRLVALLFAGDRAADAPNLRQALCEDRVVLCDRYFYSNLAYQGAKLPDDHEVDDFGAWLRKLEFGHYALPLPDCSIYLDVHQDGRRDRLLSRAAAPNGQPGPVENDIHERDLGLQAQVENMFRRLAQTHNDLVRIDCEEMGQLLDENAVHARVVAALVARQVLPASLAPAPTRASR